jgi:fucose permease
LLFGLAFGAGFIYVGTQLKGRERAQPLLIASLTLAVFFLGRFWGSPLKEIFPSGILAALA